MNRDPYSADYAEDQARARRYDDGEDPFVHVPRVIEKEKKESVRVDPVKGLNDREDAVIEAAEQEQSDGG